MSEGRRSQRDAVVRGMQLSGGRRSQAGSMEEEHRGLWVLQTPLALKLENGPSAEEDIGLWEGEKAGKQMPLCSLHKEGSLKKHVRLLLSNCEERMLPHACV